MVDEETNPETHSMHVVKFDFFFPKGLHFWQFHFSLQVAAVASEK